MGMRLPIEQARNEESWYHWVSHLPKGEFAKKLTGTQAHRKCPRADMSQKNEVLWIWLTFGDAGLPNRRENCFIAISS
jgi:hypothetical protein